jgi:Protein of unknown function (DUF2914)
MHAYLAWIPRYERQLSAVGMIAGFVTDNFMFRRVDLPNTQVIFLVYLTVAAVSIALLHIMAARATPEKPVPRWHTFLPMATQFALGSLWSGFLIFYSRSAVVLASWPFLLVLAAIFIGNEVFKHYHSRLVFTATLFFFALFSYAIVTVPILTRHIGVISFVLSGVLAIAIFAFYLWLLRRFGCAAFEESKWRIVGSSAAVYALINLFWFTDVLPPLPIALAKAGVYRSVKKTGDVYTAVGETQPWYTKIAKPPVVHIKPGESLYVYSSVFAPIRFEMRVFYDWQHYDGAHKTWVSVSRVSYPINGGRDGGYRGYTFKRNAAAGEWRVDITTAGNRLLGRVRFSVDETTTAPTVTETLG